MLLCEIYPGLHAGTLRYGFGVEKCFLAVLEAVAGVGQFRQHDQVGATAHRLARQRKAAVQVIRGVGNAGLGIELHDGNAYGTDSGARFIHLRCSHSCYSTRMG